ncbi:hypothetical protein D3C73_1564300 [compost metagenome]
MKKGTYLQLSPRVISYLKFKAAATGESMSSIVEDLISRDLDSNFEFYSKMEQFFSNQTEDEE